MFPLYLLLICVFTGGALLISFKDVFFAFTAGLTAARGLAFGLSQRSTSLPLTVVVPSLSRVQLSDPVDHSLPGSSVWLEKAKWKFNFKEDSITKKYTQVSKRKGK